MYEVKRASVYRETGLLRVLPLEVHGPTESRLLYVVGCPTKCLTFRGGRVVFDDDGNLSPEFIFIVEKPDFDIKSIIGMHLSHRPIEGSITS
ncbi:MAG: hypothetical protein U0894_07525 [Pirellulales bacterium]